MKLNKFNILLGSLLSFITIVLFILQKDIKILLLLIFLILPFIIKLKANYTLIYLIFGYLGLSGFIFHLYKTIFWYDSFVHFIWGIVSGLLSIYILIKLKVFEEKNILFNLIFIISFSLALSCLWEMFEFLSDNVFNSDMQRLKTGVFDTMKDIIIAFFGNILFILWFYYEYKNNQELLIKKFINY